MKRRGKAGERSPAARPNGGAPAARVTIHELARLAGVSATTVSRVLNAKAKGNYAAATAERVRRIAAQRGFQWNQTARSLRTRRSERLQIVATDWHEIHSSEYHIQLFQGISDEARCRGFEVLLTLVPMAEWTSGAGVAAAVARADIDGHLLAPTRFAGALPRQAAPTVSCGMRPSPANRHLAFVDCDNRAGAELATRLLLESGRRRIAHLTGKPDSSSAAERRAGYAAAMRAAGRAELVQPCGFSDRDGYLAGCQLFASEPDVDGIFAANDLAALGVLRAATEKKRRVPEDLAVVGFDGIAAGRLFHPYLTSIVQPVAEIGRTAVRLLCDWLTAGRPARREVILPVTRQRGETV